MNGSAQQSYRFTITHEKSRLWFGLKKHEVEKWEVIVIKNDVQKKRNKKGVQL